MQRSTAAKVEICLVCLIWLLIPAIAFAQVQPPRPDLPPIAAPLVREGDLAVGLVSALGMGTVSDESQAESMLGEMGITPRNGWIAGYPVTPDVLGELRKSVSDAADAGKLGMNRDEALKRLEAIAAGTGVSAASNSAGGIYGPSDYAGYVDDAAFNSYYTTEGPPIYTYYAPPVPYYDLYGYVPYPFWSSGFWFPGFYVLRDFHRSFYVGGRVVFCSNHFHDYRNGRFARIDPVGRFHGTPFASAGFPRAGSIPRTGFSGFSGPVSSMAQSRTPPGIAANPMRGGGMTGPSYRGTGFTNPGYRSAGATAMAYRGSSAGYVTSYGARPASHRSFAMASPSYSAGGFAGHSYHSSSGFSGRSMAGRSWGGGGFSGSSIGGRSGGGGGFGGRSFGGGHSSGGGRGHR